MTQIHPPLPSLLGLLSLPWRRMEKCEAVGHDGLREPAYICTEFPDTEIGYAVCGLDDNDEWRVEMYGEGYTLVTILPTPEWDIVETDEPAPQIIPEKTRFLLGEKWTDQLALPFEHTILALDPTKWGDWKAMVEFSGDKIEKFATYRVDSLGNCFWGHYCRDREEADQDYLVR